MKENNGIHAGETISSFEVVSFKNTPAHYVILTMYGGRKLFIISDMVEIEGGRELGVLKIVSNISFPQNSKPLIEKFDGGKIGSINFLSPPCSERVSAVRFKFAKGECVIASGDAPYSLFFQFGPYETGIPEFALADYSVENQVET